MHLSAVTGQDADCFGFKVPTLRNIEMACPYFPGGEAETMGEAVELMGRLQLGKKFSNKENAQIVVFLKALTGDQPGFGRACCFGPEPIPRRQRGSASAGRYAVRLNSSLPAPHTGQTQSSGMSSQGVPAGIPPSGSPSAGSYT
jgi:hypothetical protein